MNWYESLPPAEAQVPCGAGTHAVGWKAGQFAIPAHPDVEAEVVLAALGGDKPLCVEVAETWAKHADDLDVLMAGPRSRSDKVTSGWDDVRKIGAIVLGRPLGGFPGASPGGSGPGGSGAGGSGAPGSAGQGAGPGATGSGAPGGASARAVAGGRGGLMRAGMPEELARLVQSRTEMLRLLALGPAFQFRLAGTVAAAWSGRGSHQAGRRPELAAALTGRLAPAVAEWLGIDPDSVTAAPLEGASPPGWGTLQTFGSGSGRRVRASLPVGWLASVWACGLAVVDGHLVVSVEQPGWPRVRVRALREPGGTPVQLDVVATDDAPLPHWAIPA